MSEPDINWEEEYSESELESIDTDTNTDPIEVKKDPIGAYMDSTFSSGTQRRYYRRNEKTLKEFEVFVYNRHNLHPCSVSEDHIKSFNTHLKEGTAYVLQGPKNKSDDFDMSESTRAKQLSYIGRFYAWLDERDVISDNPAKLAIESLDLSVKNKDRPLITLDEMAEFLQSLTDYFVKSWFMMLLKTGVRRGEAGNIDLRDVHIDHPIYYEFIDEHEISLVAEVESKPDSLFIMGGFNEKTKKRSEERDFGNKRSRKDGTVIPVDSELKLSLLEYILTRPAPDPATQCNPLFVKQESYGSKNRITEDVIRNRVFTTLADYNSWYTSGASVTEKVDNHYFRHYFTHNHRHMRGVYEDYMPDGLRAYIRGDADSSGDSENANTARNTVYSHSDWDDWSRTVEEPYLDSIYKFGVYD